MKQQLESAPPAVVMGDLCQRFVAPDGQSMEVLRDVSVTVREREFFTVVGPSGCGKSTLLNITSGLLRPTTGSVRCLKGDRSLEQTEIGYITQDSNLYPWFTVLENVMMPLEIRKVPKRVRRERAREWLGARGLL